MTAAKRFIFPFILALVIHGFLLSMDGNWMKVKPVPRPLLSPLMISLHALVPPKPPAGPLKTVKNETRRRKAALSPHPVQKEKKDTAFKQAEIKPAAPVPIQPIPLPTEKKEKKASTPQKALLIKPAPVDHPRPPSPTDPPNTVTAAVPDIPPPPPPQSIREVHPEHGVPGAGAAHQKSVELKEPLPSSSPPPENLKEAHPLYQYNPPPPVSPKSETARLSGNRYSGSSGYRRGNGGSDKGFSIQRPAAAGRGRNIVGKEMAL